MKKRKKRVSHLSYANSYQIAIQEEPNTHYLENSNKPEESIK